MTSLIRRTWLGAAGLHLLILATSAQAQVKSAEPVTPVAPAESESMAPAGSQSAAPLESEDAALSESADATPAQGEDAAPPKSEAAASKSSEAIPEPPPSTGEPTSPPQSVEKKPPRLGQHHASEEWKWFFPILGKESTKVGYKLQLPWGAGINYSFVDQPISIDNVSIAVNDSEMVDISDLIEFESVESKVHVLNARFDLWVFPFLNVYALGLYAPSAKTAVKISEPFAFDAGASQYGVGGGFGTTLAMGWRGFFGTLDLNWTWNNMSNLEQPVGTFLMTPRIGRNFGKVGPLDVVVWVGGMRQKIAADTLGSINLRDALGGDGAEFQNKLEGWYDGLSPVEKAVVRAAVEQLQASDGATIHYQLQKSIKYPWNLVIGGQVGLTDNFQLRAEVGFLGRTQVIVGFNYRFGLIATTPSAASPAVN